MRKQIAVLTCLLFSIIHPLFGQTQLVGNGSFELGSAPWTITGAGASIFNNSVGAFSGSYFLTHGKCQQCQPVRLPKAIILKLDEPHRCLA